MRHNTLEIIPCDFDNLHHCEALVMLMNEYITDRMGDGVPYTEEQKVKLVEGLKHHPSRLVLLARAEDSFIGLTNCFINFATFSVKPYINIHDVIVLNSWRNRGVGRKMLERVIEKARELNCSKVTLEVREDNTNAKYLYRSLGFTGTEPKWYYWMKNL
jgi:ribosomal protein S18 acetylase RimI-like enzyme